MFILFNISSSRGCNKKNVKKKKSHRVYMVCAVQFVQSDFGQSLSKYNELQETLTTVVITGAARKNIVLAFFIFGPV